MVDASLAATEWAHLGFKPPTGYIRLRLVKPSRSEEGKGVDDAATDEYTLVSIPDTYEVRRLPH